MTDEDEDQAYLAAKALRQLVGRNIRRARKAAGISQEALALRVAVDQRRVSNWERGEHLPTAHNLTRLGLALGISEVGWFFTDHDQAA